MFTFWRPSITYGLTFHVDHFSGRILTFQYVHIDISIMKSKMETKMEKK